MALGAIIGGVKAIAGASTSLAEAWGATQKRLGDNHNVDRTTARDMAVAGFQADLQRGLQLDALNAAQQSADRASKWTAWIRPTACAIALYHMGANVLVATLPGIAANLGIRIAPLPFPLDWIVPGILIAVLGLRPLEKWATSPKPAVLDMPPLIAKRPALPALPKPGGANRRADEM